MTRKLMTLLLLSLPLSCEEKNRCPDGVVVSVAGNHGHAAEISSKHVETAVGGHYPMEGTADHDHVLSLKDGDMGQLRKGEAVRTVTSSVKAHVHEVEVRCK